MTVYNELNKIAYIGNASQTLYPIPFEYINTEDIKVSIYTSKNEFVEDWAYSTQYVIEGGNVKVLSGYAIDKNKKLLILRRVDLVQDNKYREGGDFPAKSTETSFDKLTMITQQLQETLDRCVKVEVLDVQSPEQLLADVYSKLDSATEVAEQAIGAANQATTAAKNANDAVVVAQQQITETQAFIEQARADINQTVEDSIEYVEQEAVKAATEVVGEVVGQYTDRAETAAKNAEADASRTAESANQASASANSAATSASEAEAIAGEVSVYNFKNKITNCITEIPQDIKLELNNGTLTLKAGSKVYVPNGVGKFDEVNFQNDTTVNPSNTDGKCFVYLNNNGVPTSYIISNFISGTTAPSSGYKIWYDTSNNVIKRYSGSALQDTGSSLSLAVVTVSGGKITSIDQVFNGFGYIGSTVFALPGVKGLIPDGRNADGSLKNVEVTIPSVKTYTSPTSYTFSNYGWVCDVNSNIFPYDLTKYEYREDENYNYELYNNEIRKTTLIAYGSVNAGVTTSFTPKLPFRAADQNDFNKLDEEAVKTSGNQTIGGSKTFTSSPTVTTGEMYFKTTNDASKTPSQAINYGQINIYDKNTNLMGGLSHYQYASGTRETLIRCRNLDGKVYQISINSKGEAQAPTPVANSNTTEIATTAWVRNYTKNTGGVNWAGKVSVAVATNYTAPSNGFVAYRCSVWNRTPKLTINSVDIFSYSGNVIAGFFGSVPVCKGDIINLSGDSEAVVYFIPFK